MVQVLHLDGVHSEFGGAFQVQIAIVDEAALVRGNLGRLQREAINVMLGLAASYKARADKEAEDLPQPELLDTVIIQLTRFVVERAHKVFTGIGERLRELQHIRERF